MANSFLQSLRDRIGGGDNRPLGDTEHAHDEISPHDLPPDHPGRRAAEEQAQEAEGVTRGHEAGGAEEA